jgi:hypothetical protein
MTTIKLLKHKKPKLQICKMLCDDGLHDKLNEYELLKFLNSHETNLFVGKPKSGKTSLIYSLFKNPFKKVFHNVFIFQPVQSGNSMKDNIFEKLPDNKKFHELNFENLESVKNIISENEGKFNSCIIFDDMTAYLKNNEILKLLKELIFNRRHLRLSIFFLVQTYLSIPREIRKMFSNCFIFKTSKIELEKIFDELMENNLVDCSDISKIIYDEQYNFMFLNTQSQRIFKNWDELIFEEI